MIHHLVLLKYKPNVTEAQKQNFYQELQNLKAALPGFVGLHQYQNCSPEKGMDKGYQEGFQMDFKNEAARDIYLLDSTHQAIAEKLVNACIGGAEGIFVFDYLVPDK